MSDFRSLLGSFQAATGMKNTGSNNNKRRIDSARQLPNSGNGNGKSGKGKGGDHQTNRKNKIQTLWRKSQIQKSIRETTAARLKQQKAVGSTCTSSSDQRGTNLSIWQSAQRLFPPSPRSKYGNHGLIKNKANLHPKMKI